MALVREFFGNISCRFRAQQGSPGEQRQSDGARVLLAQMKNISRPSLRGSYAPRLSKNKPSATQRSDVSSHLHPLAALSAPAARQYVEHVRYDTKFHRTKLRSPRWMKVNHVGRCEHLQPYWQNETACAHCHREKQHSFRTPKPR